MEVAGANRRWRWQFRCRGSRRESAVAQLSTLGGVSHDLVHCQNQYEVKQQQRNWIYIDRVACRHRHHWHIGRIAITDTFDGEVLRSLCLLQKPSASDGGGFANVCS